jgi:hypothetical protein
MVAIGRGNGVVDGGWQSSGGAMMQHGGHVGASGWLLAGRLGLGLGFMRQWERDEKKRAMGLL